MSSKRCGKCEQTKPLTDFSPGDGSHGVQWQCRSCFAAYARERYRANLEKERQRGRDKYHATTTPEIRQRTRLRHSYGLTIAEYNLLLETQQGLCVVCGSDKPNGRGSHLHIDHCHTCGEVRGLLCNGCNTGLGMLGDDAMRARAGADYLDRHAHRISTDGTAA